MSVITVENLRYQYPHAEKLALDGITFSVERGEFIGIIGENGAGKSTLSQALIGLVPQFYKGAYGGKVIVNGKEAGNTPVAQMCGNVGLVFQNPFNQLSGAKDTVYDEVAFGMQNLGVPREEMHKRAEEALKLLDIWQYRERNPFDLSGGQMQRVAIASVLVMRPDVMVLDEPTSQLDPEGSEEVFRAVEKLTKSGITILMIEQKIEKLAAYCSRILLLHQGKQIAFDTPQKIFSMENLEDYGVQAPAFTLLMLRRLPSIVMNLNSSPTNPALFLILLDKQKQTMYRCGTSLNDNCIFTRCLSSHFGRQRFFVACNIERQQENERSNHRYPANRCQYQGTAKSSRHQGQGCGRYARCIHTGGRQMAGRHCTSYHRQPCDSRRDARYEN